MGTEQDFAEFWKSYPRKIGRLAAEKVYRLVIKNGATSDEISGGLEQYLQVLPSDQRWIPHARTWLSQGRWMDEYSKPAGHSTPWWNECEKVHGSVCHNRHEHGMAMLHGLLPSQRKA